MVVENRNFVKTKITITSEAHVEKLLYTGMCQTSGLDHFCNCCKAKIIGIEGDLNFKYTLYM